MGVFPIRGQQQQSLASCMPWASLSLSMGLLQNLKNLVLGQDSTLNYQVLWKETLSWLTGQDRNVTESARPLVTSPLHSRKQQNSRHNCPFEAAPLQSSTDQQGLLAILQQHHMPGIDSWYDLQYSKRKQEHPAVYLVSLLDCCRDTFLQWWQMSWD